MESASGEPRHTGRFWSAFASIFLFALVVRAVHLLGLRDLEFFQLLGLDAAHYHRWAQQLLAGNAAAEPYFQGPLYPYFLAAIYRVGGVHVFAVQVIQFVLGGATAALSFAIGDRLFSRGIGIAAGALMAVLPTAIFLEAHLIPASLLSFVVTLALWTLLVAVERKQAIAFAAAGTLFGIAALGRGTILVAAAIGLLLLLAQALRRRDRTRMLHCALFAIGLTLSILPVSLRNLRVGGEFVLISNNGGINYYIANHDGASGLYQEIAGVHFFQDGVPHDGLSRRVAMDRAERQLSHAEASTYWLSEGLRFNREQPLTTLGLYGKKLGYLIGDYEIPQIENFDWAKRESKLLRLSPFRFGLLIALASIGILIGARGGGLPRLATGALLAYTLAILPFFITARFRAPMLPTLCVFAVAGIAALWKGSRRAPRTLLAGMFVVLALLSFRVKPVELQKASDQLLSYSRGVVAMQAGDFLTASQQFRQGVSENPGHVPSVANLAFCLDQLGQRAEAIPMYGRVLELEPENDRILEPFARALLAERQMEQAQRILLALVRVQPQNWWGHAALGDLAREQSRFADALRHWEHVATAAPPGQYQQLAQERVAELRAAQ
jgi:tetratricopeptide (TPR) repeat protein